jgi:hypothetical protein
VKAAKKGPPPLATAQAPAPPTANALLGKKPMVRALRVTLFEREVRERLSAAAVDILLDRAKVLSEGRRAASSTSGAFFGSTMLTIDLTSCADVVRERCDAPQARRLAAFMAEDPRVLKRAQRTAEREAERLAGARIRTRAADVRVRAQGVLLCIDVDVEGPKEPA